MTQTPPRLFVDADLTAGAAFDASPSQAHYLMSVMRRTAGDPVWLFNGRDGEWLAHIDTPAKRLCRFRIDQRRRVQDSSLDLWLVFAPVKNARLEILVEKATELGVTALVPVLTERTIVRRLNLDRLRAHAIEAAEQSNRLSVPDVRAPVALDALIRDWPRRRLVYADEIGPAPAAAAALSGLSPRPAAALIGPEGGFSTDERALILSAPDVVPLSLGPRLLRADTAALVTLALVQALVGDGVEARTGEAGAGPGAAG